MSLYFRQYTDKKWVKSDLPYIKFYIRPLSRSGNLDSARSILSNSKTKFHLSEYTNTNLNDAFFIAEEGFILLEENMYESAIELFKKITPNQTKIPSGIG